MIKSAHFYHAISLPDSQSILAWYPTVAVSGQPTRLKFDTDDRFLRLAIGTSDVAILVPLTNVSSIVVDKL